jgi:hypothetical protein
MPYSDTGSRTPDWLLDSNFRAHFLCRVAHTMSDFLAYLELIIRQIACPRQGSTEGSKKLKG